MGWIGVDLDGTLAQYDGWKGPDHIGVPISPMCERVRSWLAEGKDVRIFTARMERHDLIARWCKHVLGRELPITNVKDQKMVELWDDRCVQVERNTGRRITDGKIICSAIDTTSGIYVGKRHCDAFKACATPDVESEQGFIVGRFVDRAEAAQIAYRSGQIDKETSILISEDLW